MANINFIMYPSIENYNNTNKIIEVFRRENVFERCDWVVNEKIHGANFSFITNGYSIVCAKRSGLIKPEEDFFGHRKVFEKYKSSIMDLWNEMNRVRKIRGINNQIIVYGELFGGRYPHPDIVLPPGIKPVQRGIYYCPNIDWQAFDIFDGEEFLEWDTMKNLLIACHIPYIKELTRGPFLKCKDYDPNFITLVPRDLSLPPIELYNFENKAEGIVIRPLKNIEVKKIGRVMLKIKTEDFDERTRGVTDFITLRRNPAPPADANANSTRYFGSHYPTPNMNWSYRKKREKVKPVKPDMFLSFININRLESVISKEGSLTRRNEEQYTRLLFEDAMKDVKKCRDMGKKFLLMSKKNKEETRHLLYEESKKMVKDVLFGLEYVVRFKDDSDDE